MFLLVPVFAIPARAQRLIEPVPVEIAGSKTLGGFSGIGGPGQLLGGGVNAGLSVSLGGESSWAGTGGLSATKRQAPYALALTPVSGLVANAGGFSGPRNLAVLPGGGVRGAGLALPAETIEPVFREPGVSASKKASASELPTDIAAFLETAKAGDAEGTEAFLAGLPERFDGLGPLQRDAVLGGLELAAKAQPKAVALRKSLQDLIVRDELERIEPRLRGKPMSLERREEVLSKTRFLDIRWWDYLLGKVLHPEAEGVALRADKSITLHVKKGWEKLPSFVAHFRALFSHEYTHRLQFEGEANEAYGVEIPAVATEVLRAIELVGLGGLAEGLVTFIGANQLGGFESGRAWMRRDEAGKADKTALYFKGALAGAAYELAAKTGRWADAWLYHREVSAGKDPLAVEQAVLSGVLTPLHHR